MNDPFLGSEALAAGIFTRYELRSRYVVLHKDVYVPRNTELTAALRQGVLAAVSSSRRPRRFLGVCSARRAMD